MQYDSIYRIRSQASLINMSMINQMNERLFKGMKNYSLKVIQQIHIEHSGIEVSMHALYKWSRLCLCVGVCVYLGGSVTFQTEGFVTASECWGAAVHQ